MIKYTKSNLFLKIQVSTVCYSIKVDLVHAFN